MNHLVLFFLGAWLAVALPAGAQYVVVFQVHQPDLLQADAGSPQAGETGATLQLGGTPAAIGGIPPYSYQWSPGHLLNDSTTPNPTFVADTTRTFVLTVTDSAGCTAIDSVHITIQTGIPQAEAESSELFSVFPNPATYGVLNIRCIRCTNTQWHVAIRSITGQLLAEHVANGKQWTWHLHPDIRSGSMLLVSVTGESTHHFKIIAP